ncbi:39710_t:CDS:2 [Gigaspora margarita]|uniref:39710_t:CDS:1 n=1 Tax=Gigaspora margarita TaxID=4874 RepID=A0ABM8VXU8_GIGMA|nr:39710_t:CDS:2 [Gigaspora margarita]
MEKVKNLMKQNNNLTQEIQDLLDKNYNLKKITFRINNFFTKTIILTVSYFFALIEDSAIESPKLFVNEENQFNNSNFTLIENSIIFFFAIVIIELKPILIRLELSKKDFEYELDPFQILFTQAQINSYFSGDNGFTVEDTIKDLVSGRLKPQNLPTIQVALDKNNLFISANNRRLYCYQKAIQKGANFKKIPVRMVRETDERAGFSWKREKSLKIIENKT